MSKPRFGIIFILVCLATSITFAQSFFSKVASTQSASQPKNPAMSPDAFSSFSQQQQKQTQSNITQQINKSISASPFPAPGSPPVPAPAPVQVQQQQQPTQQQQPADSGGDTEQSSGYQAAPSSTGTNSGSQQGLGIKY